MALRLRARTPPKIRRLGETAIHLSRSQLRALEDLEDVQASMQRWHGKAEEELKENEEFQLAYQDWHKEMVRAARAGLAEYHSGVRDFVQTRQAIGDWKTLRRARRGFERGIKQFTREDIH